MSVKRYPEKLPKWNKEGSVKCQVCGNNAAQIKYLGTCHWCYRQYKEKDFDNPKWRAYIKVTELLDEYELAQSKL